MHVRSIRLDSALDSRIRSAASLEGASVSDFIRRAVTDRAERALGQPSNSERMAHLIGVAHGGGTGYSRRTGEEFTKMLVEARRRRK